MAWSRTEGSTRTFDVREELTGESNPRVTKWLHKVLTVNSAVSVSSPTCTEGGQVEPGVGGGDMAKGEVDTMGE